MSMNNASLGPDGEPVKRVNATYAGWPIAIAQYSSEGALREAMDLERALRRGDAPYIVAGLNILVEFGPDIDGPDDPAPDARFRDAAVELVGALDPLLGPLRAMTIDPQPLVGTAAASGADASPAP
jgi:hypothetical protein